MVTDWGVEYVPSAVPSVVMFLVVKLIGRRESSIVGVSIDAEEVTVRLP